ncbi:hypothetical protein CYQ88_08915 [Hydrogenovibrio sp. SC-1]|uniref:TatD family hydrolase n=1 Tax=Hydrogenovibrio sp. SC-1 TaxID=2065820 RepID=UPI000C7B3521|nr:TatD family hydrolase [Hydrogenovibrio sp. SC-1]PLA73838.1 hypothetical protein CYQ88_08915 [Hydrogenovibrio sp. SC-1]
MSRLFDTHCHLLAVQFNTDSGTSLILPSDIDFLSVGTEPKDWQNTLSLSKTYHQVSGAIGLHPWFVNDNYRLHLQSLEYLIVNNSTISAIGEIGLDFSSKFLPYKKQQLSVFEHQLRLAVQNDLPVSIHCYKAHNETLHLLNECAGFGFMHGFAGGSQMAKQFIKQGMLIGVNGVLLNPNARRYHQMVQEIGLASLVLETDAPYGKNLPASNPFDALLLIAEKVASLLSCSVDEVIDQTRYNAQQVLMRK